MSAADPVVPSALAARLLAPLDGPVEWLAQVDSTNRVVADRARAGAPEGLIVGADHQTAGRGRRGRAWEDRPGRAIAVSALLRLAGPPELVGTLALMAAVATADAVAELSDGPVGLVWPNDVLIGDAKVAGILCETSLAAAAIDWAVVGVGVNVAAAPRLEGTRWRAGSLAEAGFAGGRAAAAAALLRSLAVRYRQWREEGPGAIVTAFADRDLLRGRAVAVATAEGEARGEALGVDELGRLLVAGPAGELALGAGEVASVAR